ncbi:hypothetical protein K450DRAFT_221624 [Umbelopsis ramanniana AG]|uniref:SMP-LTD domain-containing protein n=1 Tax=Umbelopsis ramanniana AG TaxID=1314678 RepID=A0AAD5EIA1_UMBRA|nr:uncharacterized protein K450DRAFT_221624 [Umbelopsis ramanniana AG]KAI8583535.1 hypothetical protein K450DRAFT_221624 [Umbelopsis ramanniana AG]
MITLKAFLIIYFLGGITLIPLGVGIALFLIWLFHHHLPPLFHNSDTRKEESRPLLDAKDEVLEHAQADGRQYRRGWIRIRTEFQPDDASASIMSGIQSYVSGKSTQKKRKEKYYALLKFGTLFLFDGENDSECKLLIPIHNYQASLYPEKLLDHEVYARPNAIKLTRIGPKDPEKVTLASAPVADQKKSTANEEDFAAGDVFYIFCDRPIDKEDWYFAFLEANSSMPEDPTLPNIEYVDSTRFDQIALNQLIKTLQEDSSHRHAQWLNAILGRLFLSIYKTERINELIYHKVSKKARKVKRPGFIGEISVQNVKPGNSLPYITRPKLLSMSQSGELQAQANIHYAGSFRLEIATDITWSYSSMMKPIKVHVVLSVILKKLTGKVLVKIKAPPTNRIWIGFYEAPHMEWKIEPIVSDKPIKLTMVTNAIESKIREFMIENMVLPNMDDFPFFETDGLGGIFGEKEERTKATKKQQVEEAQEVSQNVEKIAQDLQAESFTTSSTPSTELTDDNSIIYPDNQSSISNRSSTGYDDLGGPFDHRSLPPRSATDKDLLQPRDLSKNLMNDRKASRSAPNLFGTMSLSHDLPALSSETGTIHSFESTESQETLDSNQEVDTPKRWSSTLSKLKKHIIKDNSGDSDQGDLSGSEKSDKSNRRLSDNGSQDGQEKSRSRSSTLSNSEGRNRSSFISRMNGYLEQKLNDDNDTNTVTTASTNEVGKRAALRAMAGNLIIKGKENLQEFRERHPDNKSIQLIEKLSSKDKLRSNSVSSQDRSSVSSLEIPPLSNTSTAQRDRSATFSVSSSADTQPISTSKSTANDAPLIEFQEEDLEPTAASPAQKYKQRASEALGRRDREFQEVVPIVVASDQTSDASRESNTTPTLSSVTKSAKTDIVVQPEVKHTARSNGQSDAVSEPNKSKLEHAPTAPTPSTKSRPVPPPPVPPRAPTYDEVLDSPKRTNPASNATTEQAPAVLQSKPKRPPPPVPPRIVEQHAKIEKPALPPRELPNGTQNN